MNTRNIVAGLLLTVAAALTVVVVACTDTAADCPRDTLRLQVQLNLTASLADTITVQSFAPPFTQSFKHTPSGMPGELVNVDVTFPNGYPSDKLLTLLVRGYGSGQLIGESLAQIHTLPGCTVAGATISSKTIDASPPTD
jgi:hypothetical protein